MAMRVGVRETSDCAQSWGRGTPQSILRGGG